MRKPSLVMLGATVALAVCLLVPVRAQTYLLNETFDAAGYDLGGWSENICTTGTVDEDATTAPAPLVGTQSLKIITASASCGLTTNTFTSGTERWAYFQVLLDTSTNNNKIFSFWTSGGAELCVVRVVTANTVTADHGTASNGSTATTDTVVDDTVYHIWVHFDADDCTVQFNTTATPPGCPSTKCAVDGGGAGGTTNTVVVGGTNSDGVVTWYFDKILVDDADIGDLTGGGATRPPANMLRLGVGLHPEAR
jgi:hypothetical protein